MAKENVEISLHMNSETNDLIQRLCDEGKMTLSDLFKKSLALMMFAIENRKMGNHLMVVNQQNEPVTEIKDL